MLCQEIFAHSLQQHQQIALLSGDVLTDSSDALAVPCDKNLLLYTSLAGQAEALAGGSLRPLIRQVLQQIPDGVCPVGNAIALPVSECELSRRGFRHLILAVTPSYGDTDAMQTLGKLTQSILEAAVQVGAVRVSIPLLRPGIDDLLSARFMLWACGCFMQNHPDTVLQARFTALMPHDKTLHQAMQFCLAGESPEARVSAGPRTAQPAAAASAPAVQQVQQVQWEWCSDNSQSQPGQQYQPYDTQASAQIEQAFQRRSDIKPGNPVEKITITGSDYHVIFDPLAGLHFQQNIRLGTKRHIRRTTPNTTPNTTPAPPLTRATVAIPAQPAQSATAGPPPQLPPPPPLTPGVHALAVPLVSVVKVSGEIERASQLAGICVYQDTEGNLILHGTDIEGLRQLRDYMLAPSFPEQWTPFAATTGYFEVAADSEEFAAVKHLFDASRPGTLEKVERVQHKAAWARYVKTRSLIAAKNGLLGVNEKLLFHGTRSPEAIAMLEGAFSVTYSNGGMWGKAVYFAEKASYSRTYAHLTAGGKKQMFLASVSVGRSVKLAPDSSLRLPPPLPEDPALRYDTVQGETGGSDVYMVYENDRACPVYRLTFT